MKPSNVPTLDRYWEQLANEVLNFSPEEPRAAATLYRNWQKGRQSTPINWREP